MSDQPIPYKKIHIKGTESILIRNIVFCTESVQKLLLLYVKLLKKYGIRTEIVY